MNQTDFKQSFLAIVNDDTDKYDDDDAASLLTDAVLGIAEMEGWSFEEAAESLSERPNYGTNGEVGGVNIDHQTGVSYVEAGGESTWVTLDILVEAVLKPGNGFNWWNNEWTTGQTDEEIEEELAAEAIEDACDRRRFEIFGTGSPIVNIEYSYDKDFMYQKYGRITTKAEITLEQFSYLNSLFFNDVIEAGYVFNKASNGMSRAPIHFRGVR